MRTLYNNMINLFLRKAYGFCLMETCYEYLLRYIHIFSSKHRSNLHFSKNLNINIFFFVI